MMLRYRKNDPTHNVFVAVQRFIKANGGSAVLMAGPEVQRWPGEGDFKYRIALQCTGRAPKAKAQ